MPKLTKPSGTSSSDSVFTGVKSENIADWWDGIEWMVKDIAARSHGRHTVRSLVDMILEQRAQMWISIRDEKPESLTLTMISVYPDTKICTLFASCGHNPQNWAGFIENIEEWARNEGCSRIEAVARPGWQKRLSDYKRTHVVLEKSLAE